MKLSKAEHSGKKWHLLLLAYAFPPSRAVGALRAWYMAKHLVRLGWRVTVVTPDPALITGIGDPAKCGEEIRRAGIERILTGHDFTFLQEGYLRQSQWLSSLPVRAAARLAWLKLGVPREIGWRRPTERACAAIAPGEVDVVIATAPPHFAFRMANDLAAELEARLVVDYRDLWVDNPHGRVRRSRRREMHEKSILGVADGVIVAAPTMQRVLGPRTATGIRSATVLNGYDPEDFGPVPAIAFEDAAVVYAGSIYPPKNSVAPVLRAIQQANGASGRDGRRLRLHYYGPAGAEVEKEAGSIGAFDCLVLHGNVTRQEVIAALKGATAVAIVTTILPTQSIEERTIVTSKIFEAFGAGARVLLVAPPESDARRVFDQYGLGGAFRGDEIDHMAEWLRSIALAGPPVSGGRANRFSWTSTVGILDEFLREIVASPRRGGDGQLKGVENQGSLPDAGEPEPRGARS